MSVTFETGDLVSNPLFGKGIVIESFGDKVVVNRNNKAFGLKTVNKNIFEADIKNRLIKKKNISKNYDEQYFDINKNREITNDML